MVPLELNIDPNLSFVLLRSSMRNHIWEHPDVGLHFSVDPSVLIFKEYEDCDSIIYKFILSKRCSRGQEFSLQRGHVLSRQKCPRRHSHSCRTHQEFRKLGPKCHVFQNRRRGVKIIFYLPFALLKVLGDKSHRLDHFALLLLFIWPKRTGLSKHFLCCLRKTTTMYPPLQWSMTKILSCCD